MPSSAKPRSKITPDSFSVAPELLGKPLAGPWRRAAAMMLDLLLVAILIMIGGGALLGLVFTFILLRTAGRFQGDRMLPRWTRTALRVSAALVVFMVGVGIWQNLADRMSTSSNDAETSADHRWRTRVSASKGGRVPAPDNDSGSGAVNVNFSPAQGIAVARLSVSLRGQNDSVEARRLADSLFSILSRTNAAGEMAELHRAAHEMMGSSENEVVRVALDNAFREPAAVVVPGLDSLAIAYAAALQSGDSAAAKSMQSALGTALAADRINDLEHDLTNEKQQSSQLRQRVDEMENQYNVRVALSNIADDLGLGFGWLALYFTSFLALMQGQTPGKRLLGLRVVRLDARPVGWWIAFERFGGYAASATLGLMGFMQILWDRNRQGFHDKAVETVVIKL